MPSVAQNILDVGINSQPMQGARLDEIAKRVKAHQLFQEARDGFLTGEYTADEFLELAELYGINVDSYLANVDRNLQTIGIIV